MRIRERFPIFRRISAVPTIAMAALVSLSACKPARTQGSATKFSNDTSDSGMNQAVIVRIPFGIIAPKAEDSVPCVAVLDRKFGRALADKAAAPSAASEIPQPMTDFIPCSSDRSAAFQVALADSLEGNGDSSQYALFGPTLAVAGVCLVGDLFFRKVLCSYANNQELKDSADPNGYYQSHENPVNWDNWAAEAVLAVDGGLAAIGGVAAGAEAAGMVTMACAAGVAVGEGALALGRAIASANGGTPEQVEQARIGAVKNFCGR